MRSENQLQKPQINWRMVCVFGCISGPVWTWALFGVGAGGFDVVGGLLLAAMIGISVSAILAPLLRGRWQQAIPIGFLSLPLGAFLCGTYFELFERTMHTFFGLPALQRLPLELAFEYVLACFVCFPYAALWWMGAVATTLCLRGAILKPHFAKPPNANG